MEMPSLERSQGSSCWFGKTRLVTVCACRVEGSLSAVSSRYSSAAVTSVRVWTNPCELGRQIVRSFCQEPHCSQCDTNELLARLEGRSSLKNLEPNLFAEEGSPVHGDVIEFHGPEGTGKTEMLYHLIARCIIPKSGGGLEVEVMFIDTDYHFDMLRLVTILEHRLEQSTEEMMKHCLGRLFLVNCNSSTQLLLTLYSLENMFCTHPSLCLLILDSISAFYWIDRSNGGESLNLQEMNLKKCANFLEKLVREHHLVLFATTQSIMQKSTNSAESFFPLKLQHEIDADYRPYLCKSWQQMVTHRIFFSKQFNSGNGKDFTLVSCHLKKNHVAKRSFSITECGVQF